MPDWMTEPGDTIEAIVRNIARNETLAVLREHGLIDAGSAEAMTVLGALKARQEHALATAVTCGARDPKPTGWVCQKPVHRGRHLYKPVAVPPPDNGWRDVTHFTLTSGSRRYSINVGHPVKVLGFGKRTASNPDGSAQAGWFVTKIQQRGEEINVSVRKDRTGPERTVKADKIVYVRPKKVAA